MQNEGANLGGLPAGSKTHASLGFRAIAQIAGTLTTRKLTHVPSMSEGYEPPGYKDPHYEDSRTLQRCAKQDCEVKNTSCCVVA